MELVQYIRDNKRRPYGVLIAYPINDEIRVGFSQCNTKEDLFDKELGKTIARERAKKRKIADYLNEWNTHLHVPINIRKVLPSFLDRCKRYYKDKDVISLKET